MFCTPLRNRFSPTLLVPFACLMLVLGLSGCQPDSATTTPQAGDPVSQVPAPVPAPAPLTKVTLAQSPQPLATLSIIAVNKGFYKDEGLDVSVKEFTTGKLCFDAMLSGGADFATVAETPIMYAGFSNQPIYVVASICSNPLSAKVIARKDQGVVQPADLKGKLVGTFKGGSAEYFFMQFLKKYGLTVEDVKVTYMQPPELVAAISRGDLAAMSMWEPNISVAQKAIGEENTTIFTGDDIYTETFHVTTRKDFADNNDYTVKRLIRALVAAERFIKSNPEEAKQIIQHTLQIDPDILSRIWPHYRFEVFLETSTVDLMTKEALYALESNAVAPGSDIPDYRQVFNTRFLQEVSPVSVSWF